MLARLWERPAGARVRDMLLAQSILHIIGYMSRTMYIYMHTYMKQIKPNVYIYIYIYIYIYRERER